MNPISCTEHRTTQSEKGGRFYDLDSDQNKFYMNCRSDYNEGIWLANQESFYPQNLIRIEQSRIFVHLFDFS